MTTRQPLATRLREAMDSKTKPVGALGRLESLGVQIGLLQQTLTPNAERCELLLFAADHGIAASGVSAYPPEVTRQMVANFLEGGAAASVMSQALDVTLKVIDAGVAGDANDHPALLNRRVAAGTANAHCSPAMNGDQYETAWRHGTELGEIACSDVICLGEMGIGNTSSAALIGHKITGIPLASLVGPGTGLDAVGVDRKLEVLSQAAARTPTPLAPRDAMIEYGGFEIAMMAAAMTAAARRHRLVLVDGFIATAAALHATALAPEIAAALVYAHRSAEPGHDHLLAHLEATPLLDLRMRLGEGTGALLAWPIVKSAAAVLRDMASFAEAGVSGRT
ncbi:MAG: nicotinate-nucleotide--dimethylbenzimidazole phosphoribosyltransferase [Pseudomonadota bacterium]